MKKEIKEIMKYADELGWAFVRMTSDGHYLMRHGVTRQQMPVPSTPNGGKRGLKNCRADLKRYAEQPAERRRK